MAITFEAAKVTAKHPNGAMVEAYQVRMLFLVDFYTHDDEMYHHAIFETREQADHLVAQIFAANSKLDYSHWLPRVSKRASKVNGCATETVFIPAVKF